ncbi:MAG: hypothetical protein FWF51_08355 [Chitinivibrionia bacterium]|nr:hypothetical protein [Chitinivibrionia bacterium]
MAEKRNNTYNKAVDETLKNLIDLFGAHLLSVSSFLQTIGGFKPVLLVQLDEPFINLLKDANVSNNKKSIPSVLKEVATFPIYIITPREIAAFADDFPIELIHMKNRYRKLYGEDPVAKMNVDINNLRRAVKTSLQGILMHLRTAYLSRNFDDLFICEIVNRIYYTLESALYLRSQSIPSGLGELVFKVESCYNPKNSVLSEIAANIESGETKGIADNMLSLISTLEEILSGVIKGIPAEEN